jgi:ParB-like chromosome segregation protein Spo0J
MTKRKEAAAVYVDPKLLTPWGKNPRRNQSAIPKVVESLRRFGFGAPIVARKADRTVIAGHTRLAAALELGLTEVPVRYLDLSEAEAHALALADNRLGEEAEWDAELLAEVLGELRAAEVKVEGLGFTDEELDAIIDGAKAVGDDEWGGALGDLPEGDRAPIQTMTFTLHDDQVAVVKGAMDHARTLGPFVDTGNENGNGNALARICETFLRVARG